VSSLCEKGFGTEVVESVAAELLDKGLLDDARLARDIVASGQRASKSRSRIYADMRRRGIARDEAEESLQACFDPEREREALAQLMRRSLSCLPGSPREADIEKTAGRLFRRGFSAAAIADVLGDIRQDEGG
jgi:regulatory protein